MTVNTNLHKRSSEVPIIIEVGYLGCPRGPAGSQPAPEPSSTPMAGYPCNQAMSPHARSPDTCHTDK